MTVDEPEAIWVAHEREVGAILERCGQALRSPVPGGMTYVEHRASLSRLQGKTAERLGKKREELEARFDAEQERLKKLCGL